MTHNVGQPDPQDARPPRGRRGRRRPAPEPSGGRRDVVLVAIVSIVAIVLAGAALFITLARPSATADASCRSVAWNALPSATALPAGWSMTASGFYTDGYGASFSGPAPSSSAATAPGVSVRVSCYGADSHQAVTRSHDADLAVGGTEVPFADIGDEAVATQDAAGSMTSVYIRRGPLVASLAAPSTVDPADLEQAARALDDAMAAAEASGGVASAETPAAEATDLGPSDAAGSESPAPTIAETHDAPELEAILPRTLAGTSFATQSTLGMPGLGDDPSSQALSAKLKDLGKNAADLQIAEAYDPTGTVDADLIAFRLNGLTAAQLRGALTESWLGAGASGVTTSTQTIAGKRVLVVDYGDAGSKDYVFEQGDAIVDLVTSDPAVAQEVVGTFK